MIQHSPKILAREEKATITTTTTTTTTATTTTTTTTKLKRTRIVNAVKAKSFLIPFPVPLRVY